jgi:hypothetical protein
LRSFGLAVCRSALFVPTTKIKRNSHARGAQFVRNSAIDHRTSYDHASYGQGSYALCSRAATAAFLDQAPLQDAHHCIEDGLESALCTYAAARDICGQCNHGTGVLDILEVLARKVGVDDLWSYVGR